MHVTAASKFKLHVDLEINICGFVNVLKAYVNKEFQIGFDQ